jgi:hypothetical protein
MAVNRFSCPGCKTTLKITTPELVGKKIRCPKCGTITLVPGGEPHPAAKPEPKPEWKPEAQPEPEPAAATTPAMGEDEIANLLAGGDWEDAPQEPAAKATASAPAPAREEPAPVKEEMADDVILDEQLLQEEVIEEEIAPVEEEEEEEKPRKAAKPPAKKRGLNVVAILVVLIVLGYAGALTASMMGMLDPDLGPDMPFDQAKKILEAPRK